MKKILSALAAFAFCMAAAPARAASAVVTDYSDLWWNPSENGWGAHVTLQDDILFTVLYVYDSARQPRFFVAPDMRRTSTSEAKFEGALYQTNGPAFSGAFNPALVQTRSVGTARFNFSGPAAATLDYTVDGVTVSKALARQSWRPIEIAGDYKGGLFASATPSTCPLGLPSIAYNGSLNVRQSGDQVTITGELAPGFAEWAACRLSGRLVQAGSLVSIENGTYTCEFENTNVTSGTFTLSAIEATANGFSGRYEAVEGAACRHSGYLGGIRRGYTIVAPEPELPY